ncbi:MAG: FAD-binding oxidoreductase, partial [candidate division KSB1 bacterium]|nr:FAD-binding oxidoreductase [candidate division KSB1 bacterium]
MSILLENNLASYNLKPEKILIPNDSQDIVRLFKDAHRESRKIAIYGNGTQSGLGGPLSVGDITLSTRGLDAIIEHDVQNLTATVQSGIEFTSLQSALKSKGQFIPLDPYIRENATIGGVVATDASGPRRYHFGTWRDLILGMTFILPDATSAKIGGKTMKNVAGFEIGKLFIGSMGTLGVIDRLTFRLYPVPDMEKTVLIVCENDDAFRRVQKRVLASKLVFTTIELLDSNALNR